MFLQDSKEIPLVRLKNSSHTTLDEQKYDQVNQDADNTGSIQQCSWGIGFITPFFMIAPYVLGLCVSSSHSDNMLISC